MRSSEIQRSAETQPIIALRRCGFDIRSSVTMGVFQILEGPIAPDRRAFG